MHLQIGQGQGTTEEVDTGLVQKISRERRAVVNYGKLSEDQVAKLRQDLEIASVNLDIFSELLTELTPGQVRPVVRYP